MTLFSSLDKLFMYEIRQNTLKEGIILFSSAFERNCIHLDHQAIIIFTLTLVVSPPGEVDRRIGHTRQPEEGNYVRKASKDFIENDQPVLDHIRTTSSILRQSYDLYNMRILVNTRK
jgi:hypothetical protein